MSMKIEEGEIADAIKLIKKECVGYDEMSPYEINSLAMQLVTASNIYDSAALISESIAYLNQNCSVRNAVGFVHIGTPAIAFLAVE